MLSHHNRVKVLTPAGAGRMGGTLLGQILGQHPQMLYVGELRELWTPALTVDRLCGCGRKVIECPFWAAVFEKAYGGLGQVDTAMLSALRLKFSRTRNVPMTWIQR